MYIQNANTYIVIMKQMYSYTYYPYMFIDIKYLYVNV